MNRLREKLAKRVAGKGKRVILIKGLILMISCVGFIAQVVQMSSEYFRYTTSNRIQTIVPQQLRPPTVAVCVRYFDIFDSDRFFADTGVRMNRVHDLQTAINESPKATVAQIFKYTPPAEEAMQSCMFRVTDVMLTAGGREACNRQFSVDKFYTQEYICYRVRERRQRQMSAVMIDHSLHAQFKFFDISMSRAFTNASLVTAISYDQGYPYVARDFAPFKILFTDEVSLANKSSNFLLVSGTWIAFELLPSPYDTKCQQRRETRKYECNRDCLISGMKPMHVVPYSELLLKPYAERHLNLRDLTDDATYARVMHLYHSCHRRCYFIPCNNWISITSTDEDLRSDGFFGFTALSPDTPDTVTTAVPTMKPVEFFSFICGCFGTWFGVSFMSLASVTRILNTRIHRQRRQGMQVTQKLESGGWRLVTRIQRR